MGERFQKVDPDQGHVPVSFIYESTPPGLLRYWVDPLVSSDADRSGYTWDNQTGDVVPLRIMVQVLFQVKGVSTVQVRNMFVETYTGRGTIDVILRTIWHSNCHSYK